jgi:hypothetical protein
MCEEPESPPLPSPFVPAGGFIAPSAATADVPADSISNRFRLRAGDLKRCPLLPLHFVMMIYLFACMRLLSIEQRKQR